MQNGRHDWIVGPKEAHQRLSLFLREKFHGRYSAKMLKRWVEGNRCEINGIVERFASRQVLSGDRVVFRVPTDQEVPRRPVIVQDRILYEDVDLLLYNKPPAVTSEALVALLDQSLGGVQLVHRLDRDTSGVMLFTRNESAKKAVEDLFRKRKVSKTYLAIVDGIPRQTHGTITNYLGKLHVYQGQAIWGAVNEANGQYAETSWKVLGSGKEASLIECYPKTGRTHQIRVHMKEMGHPILGDYQYARHPFCQYRPLRPLLHASKLVLEHPATAQPLEVTADLPNDFLEGLAVLKIRDGKGAKATKGT